MELNLKDPEYQAFVRGLRQQRHEETGYLAFADWLDERRGVDHPFASFIRACCEAGRIWDGPIGYMGPAVTRPNPISSRRQYQIWQAVIDGLKAYWIKQPFFTELGGESRKHWSWRYGFPSRVFCSTWHWLNHGHQICAIGPVGEVVLTDRPTIHIEAGQTVVEMTWGHPNPTWAQPKTPTVLVEAADYFDPQADRYATVNMIAMRMLTEIFPEDLVEEFQFNARL